MIRLLKPLSYYEEKYGTAMYGLNKLYLLMEKEHNRGQEAAGVGAVKLDAIPGNEYIFRERAQGSDAIQTICAPMAAKIVWIASEPCARSRKIYSFPGIASSFTAPTPAAS